MRSPSQNNTFLENLLFRYDTSDLGKFGENEEIIITSFDGSKCDSIPKLEEWSTNGGVCGVDPRIELMEFLEGQDIKAKHISYSRVDGRSIIKIDMRDIKLRRLLCQ